MKRLLINLFTGFWKLLKPYGALGQL